MIDIELNFSSINIGPKNKFPRVELLFNDQIYYQGLLKNLKISVPPLSNNSLKILFVNKECDDTTVDHNGNIVLDMNFSLESIVVDGFDLGNIIWEGVYHCNSGPSIPGCLFFGPGGHYHIDLLFPIIPYILEKNHKLNNNHPNWEQDLNCYQNACQLLNTLLTE